MSDEEKGFVVRDRRRLNPEGDNMDETGQDFHAETETAETGTEPKSESGPNRPGEGCGGPPPLPEVNFSTFIFSLSTSALLHLGELPDPNTRETCRNLPLAKQTIDILGMLERKTKGNLDGDEENLLSNLLYELRMKFVAASKK